MSLYSSDWNLDIDDLDVATSPSMGDVRLSIRDADAHLTPEQARLVAAALSRAADKVATRVAASDGFDSRAQSSGGQAAGS